MQSLLGRGLHDIRKQCAGVGSGCRYALSYLVDVEVELSRIFLPRAAAERLAAVLRSVAGWCAAVLACRSVLASCGCERRISRAGHRARRWRLLPTLCLGKAFHLTQAVDSLVKLTDSLAMNCAAEPRTRVKDRQCYEHASTGRCGNWYRCSQALLAYTRGFPGRLAGGWESVLTRSMDNRYSQKDHWSQDMLT